VSAGVILVVPDDLLDIHRRVVDSAGADRVVLGGITRARSVRCGLKVVPPEAEFILVHDAARPLATPALFEAVLAAVADGGAAGAVPGIGAHRRLPSDEATDDASLVEAMGETVVVVLGEETNLKITTPEDLLTAERYLDYLNRPSD
jgi:2-C-methyl-D-erythritol 4-phosphate cytidylyltransferase